VDDLTVSLLRQLETSATDLKKLVVSVALRNPSAIGIASHAIERWERDDPRGWSVVRGWLRSLRISVVVS